MPGRSTIQGSRSWASSPLLSTFESRIAKNTSSYPVLLKYLSGVMSISREFHGQHTASTRHAGVISRIRVENFMCHSSLEIVLGDHVNFITGQNGSGKSAILTALCIAFGCRAKGTQRASTLKDFIKTGSSHSSVQVEISNEGNDAFKPEVFGHLIILERKISEATSSTILKDHQGKKVASRKEDLQELVDHFNIDVESPCVIMSQDKSREFLHSGSDRDKFKFFFKATLLQQVNDLLLDVRARLSRANGLVEQLESTIRPIVEELDGMLVKIRSMEQVQEISEKVHLLKKKLAWAWVYDVDKQLQDHTTKLEKLRDRVPTCQSRIDKHSAKANGLREQLSLKKCQIAQMMEKTSEVRRSKEELEHKFSLATKERLEFLEEHKRKSDAAQKMKERVKILEQQILDIEEQHIKDTQAEEDEYEEKLKGMQTKYEASNEIHLRLNEEEKELLDDISVKMNKVKEIASVIEALQKKHRDISISIKELQQNKRNEVTAFGGERVIHLLRAIERRHNHFKSPPIGPIGAHLTLLHGDMWASAVEYALGKLLNAFIVTDHKDSLLLRECAREADYNHLQIIIYDFSRPNLDLPNHMLPQTNHPTTLSALHSNNPTVLNVLVDVGGAERQVLVKDYDAGKSVAFDQRIANLKEVFTLEGYKMFSRNSVQTILPPHRKARTQRLSRSFDDQIKNLQRESSDLKEQTDHSKVRKREAEENIQSIQDKFQSVKKRCTAAERDVMSKKFKLEDFRRSHAQEKVVAPEFSVDELRQEVSRILEDITVNDNQLEQFQARINEAEGRASDLKISLEELRVSAKGDIDAFEAAERELLEIEENLRTAEGEILHYEGVMKNKVIRDIEEAETQRHSFEETRKENCRKASIICPESEVHELGGCHSSTPEHLSAQLNKLQLRFQRESVRYSESIDDLRMLYEKKQRRIIRKQKTYEGFRKKLTAFEKALQLRFMKFERNANSLKKQLTWQFNKHLRKKGVSGLIKVNYEEKTLKIEVKMPHDASKTNVRDTRGLSGGERSFSTLCFALALHEMTESPFRAMDEFDVFMDAVSRKISLDTLVEFASTQGSQWIFITPHDISSVKQSELVKKQQLAAPRA